MEPIVRVSPPQLREGRWHCKAAIQVGDDVILIHASAPRGLARQALGVASRYVSVEPYAAFSGEGGIPSFGCANCGQLKCGGGAFGEDEAAGVFDDIMNVVGKVADNPIVKAAANVIPYGNLVVGGASAAAGLYSAVRSGQPKAKKRLKRIKNDARRGVPAARKALGQLQSAARADTLRKAVRRGAPQAARQLQQISAAVSRDPAALEAATMLKALELADKGIPEAPPPEYDLPIDAGEAYADMLSGEIAAAVARRAGLSIEHRRVLDNLNAILRTARTRAARR
jgi:hypothetical protein